MRALISHSVAISAIRRVCFAYSSRGLHASSQAHTLSASLPSLKYAVIDDQAVAVTLLALGSRGCQLPSHAFAVAASMRRHKPKLPAAAGICNEPDPASLAEKLEAACVRDICAVASQAGCSIAVASSALRATADLLGWAHVTETFPARDCLQLLDQLTEIQAPRVASQPLLIPAHGQRLGRAMLALFQRMRSLHAAGGSTTRAAPSQSLPLLSVLQLASDWRVAGSNNDLRSALLRSAYALVVADPLLRSWGGAAPASPDDSGVSAADSAGAASERSFYRVAAAAALLSAMRGVGNAAASLTGAGAQSISPEGEPSLADAVAVIDKALIAGVCDGGLKPLMEARAARQAAVSIAPFAAAVLGVHEHLQLRCSALALALLPPLRRDARRLMAHVHGLRNSRDSARDAAALLAQASALSSSALSLRALGCIDPELSVTMLRATAGLAEHMHRAAEKSRLSHAASPVAVGALAVESFAQSHAAESADSAAHAASFASDSLPDSTVPSPDQLVQLMRAAARQAGSSRHGAAASTASEADRAAAPLESTESPSLPAADDDATGATLEAAVAHAKSAALKAAAANATAAALEAAVAFRRCFSLAAAAGQCWRFDESDEAVTAGGAATATRSALDPSASTSATDRSAAVLHKAAHARATTGGAAAVTQEEVERWMRLQARCARNLLLAYASEARWLQVPDAQAGGCARAESVEAASGCGGTAQFAALRDSAAALKVNLLQLLSSSQFTMAAESLELLTAKADAAGLAPHALLEIVQPLASALLHVLRAPITAAGWPVPDGPSNLAGDEAHAHPAFSGSGGISSRGSGCGGSGLPVTSTPLFALPFQLSDAERAPCDDALRALQAVQHWGVGAGLLKPMRVLKARHAPDNERQAAAAASATATAAAGVTVQLLHVRAVDAGGAGAAGPPSNLSDATTDAAGEALAGKANLSERRQRRLRRQAEQEHLAAAAASGRPASAAAAELKVVYADSDCGDADASAALFPPWAAQMLLQLQARAPTSGTAAATSLSAARLRPPRSAVELTSAAAAEDAARRGVVPSLYMPLVQRIVAGCRDRRLPPPWFGVLVPELALRLKLCWPQSGLRVCIEVEPMAAFASPQPTVLAAADARLAGAPSLPPVRGASASLLAARLEECVAVVPLPVARGSSGLVSAGWPSDRRSTLDDESAIGSDRHADPHAARLPVMTSLVHMRMQMQMHKSALRRPAPLGGAPARRWALARCGWTVVPVSQPLLAAAAAGQTPHGLAEVDSSDFDASASVEALLNERLWPLLSRKARRTMM